jgi:hypothetical protein
VPDPPPAPRPPAWKRAWRWWLGKAALLAGKQNHGLSWLAFWLGLGPVAKLMHARGEDRLDRALRPAAPSAWHRREQPIATDPRRIRRPF